MIPKHSAARLGLLACGRLAALGIRIHQAHAHTGRVVIIVEPQPGLDLRATGLHTLGRVDLSQANPERQP